MEVGDDDPGVISTFAADDVAGRRRINSPESSLERQYAVDPTQLQFGKIRGGQIGPDPTSSAKNTGVLQGIAHYKLPTVGRISIFCLRAVVV